MSLKVQLNLEIGDLVTCRQMRSTNWLGIVISHHRDHKGQEMVNVRWSVSPNNNKWRAGQYYNWYYSNQPDEGLEKVTS
jgi:hypothetical protein